MIDDRSLPHKTLTRAFLMRWVASSIDTWAKGLWRLCSSASYWSYMDAHCAHSEEGLVLGMIGLGIKVVDEVNAQYSILSAGTGMILYP